MKKILFVLPLILLFLTSCSESTPLNINIFQENINETFDSEILNLEKLETVKKDDRNVIYWIPDDYDICCALYTDPKSGIIEKYTLTGFIDDKKFDSFNEKFYKAITVNNSHIKKSNKTAGTLRLEVYEDKRYVTENENPTLKNNIKEENVTYPVLETTKPIN